MARTLDMVSGAATGLKGFFEGQDAEEQRQRSREIYKSGKSGRERAEEKAGLEHDKFKRDFADEEEARQAAADAAQGDAGPRTLKGATTTGVPIAQTATPLTRAGAGAAPGAATTAPAAGADQDEPEEAPELWLRQAKAQADLWTKKGRPERAQKVLTDAISAKIAENEAYYKFKILPREHELRTKNLTADELKADMGYQDLQRERQQLDVKNAGLMWGHMLQGNKPAAIRAFNNSNLTAAGVRVADIGQSPDGKMIMLLDERGEVVKDKDGKKLIYPRQLLDNLYRQATTSTITVKKGDTIAQTRTSPAGDLTVTPVFTAKDPTEERQGRSAERSEDSQWATVLNQARDDSHKYIKDALGLTANALGQVMKPENMPIFEKAQPLVEAELQKYRASGKRMDQVTVTDLAKRALAQARDEYEREKRGAGTLDSGNPNAPAGGGPTWRDVLN